MHGFRRNSECFFEPRCTMSDVPLRFIAVLPVPNPSEDITDGNFTNDWSIRLTLREL